MADFLEGEEGFHEASEINRQARITEEKFKNIGYKQALFESRQGNIQPGFDFGFQASAMASFCETFSEVVGDKVPIIIDLEELLPSSLSGKTINDLRETHENIISKIRSLIPLSTNLK